MLVGFLGLSLLRAEAVHVRDYGTHEPTDRHVLFAMAVTADQDVLSFVAKADGKWRLTRIHGWLEKRPAEQTIDILGWPGKKPAPNAVASLSLLNISLLVTKDGKYAVGAADAYWALNGQRGGRSDDLISVIDLPTFAVVKSIHTSDLGQESWQVFISPSGQLALQARTGQAKTGQAKTGESLRLVLLGLPDLNVEKQCRDSEIRGGEDEVCRATVGASSLRNSTNKPETRQGRPCTPSGEAPDHRFAKESCVTDKLTETILSRESGKEVGKIEETIHNSVQSQFADQNGHDYVLVMEGGTKLKVYEIKE
jgi:hypothetical protein